MFLKTRQWFFSTLFLQQTGTSLQKRNLNPRNALIFPCGFEFWIKQVQSPCQHGRECYTAVNQSINQSTDRSNRRFQVIQSINQSITYYWLLLTIQIKQSINLSVPWHFKCTQSINQSIMWLLFHNQFSSWIVEVFRFWWFSAPFWVMRKIMEPWDGEGVIWAPELRISVRRMMMITSPRI